MNNIHTKKVFQRIYDFFGKNEWKGGLSVHALIFIFAVIGIGILRRRSFSHNAACRDQVPSLMQNWHSELHPKRGYKFIARTQIVKIDTNEKVTVYIQSNEAHSGALLYELLCKQEEGSMLLLGKIELYTVRIEEGKFICDNFISALDQYHSLTKYGRENWGKPLTKIYIKWVEAYHKAVYKGIGTKLLQIAIEKSMQCNSEGRIALDASYNSHGFYYKLGLRCHCDQKKDQEIAKELVQAKQEQRDPNTRNQGIVAMYLPEKGLQIWKEKIDQDPMLFFGAL